METTMTTKNRPEISPVRRTTIFCRDMEQSLRCYRDILGLTVIEDKRVSGPAIASMMGLDDCTIRIIHLQSGTSPDGLVGLYAIEEGRPEALPMVKTSSIMLGQVVVVFYTSALARVHRDVISAGLTIMSSPREYIKTEPSAYTPVGTYAEMIFFDPDGVPVNIVQYTPPEQMANGEQSRSFPPSSW